MKITFIGGGNMGTAILAALIGRKLAAPGDITVSDVSAERLDFLKKEYGVKVTTESAGAVRGVEAIVLAVKPQILDEVAAGLSGKLEDGQLVISILAGSTIGAISGGLRHKAVVRVMPNTPAQIGMGMSVWTATAEVTDGQRELAAAILGAVGKQIYVEDEKYLDMATAVSGSGPAYFFLFVEALVSAAVELGFTASDAQEMVVQTMLGSGNLILQSGKTPAELREMVTSKGGTTAAALAAFGEGGFTELVNKAVRAAFIRAGELGGGSR